MIVELIFIPEMSRDRLKSGFLPQESMKRLTIIQAGISIRDPIMLLKQEQLYLKEIAKTIKKQTKENRVVKNNLLLHLEALYSNQDGGGRKRNSSLDLCKASLIVKLIGSVATARSDKQQILLILLHKRIIFIIKQG